MKTFKDECNELICLINGIIAANEDDRNKEIGDRVVIWDGSSNIDKNTKEKRCGIDPLFKDNSGIVIENNCKIIYSDEFQNRILQGNYDKICDLLIKFPSGEEIYCSSKFVRIIN